MSQANKDGYLERQENIAYSGLINLSILCTNRERSNAINEIALLRRIDPFPQSPSGSVLLLGLCFKLCTVTILFYWPWRCPKEIGLILIHFVFLTNSMGLGMWAVYLPRRRKVNVTEKKRSIEELCYLFTEKKCYTGSLSYPSCCYKMPGKSPWRKDGFTSVQ